MSHWDPKFGPGPSDQGYQQMDQSMFRQQFYMANNTYGSNNLCGPSISQNTPTYYTVEQIESQYSQGNDRHKKQSNNYAKTANNGNVVDESNSNLHANAMEFHPGTLPSNVEVPSTSGAVKKGYSGENSQRSYRSRNHLDKLQNDDNSRYERNHRFKTSDRTYSSKKTVSSEHNKDAGENNLEASKKIEKNEQSNARNVKDNRKYDRNKQYQSEPKYSSESNNYNQESNNYNQESSKPSKEFRDNNSEYRNYDKRKPYNLEKNKKETNEFNAESKNYGQKSKEYGDPNSEYRNYDKNKPYNSEKSKKETNEYAAESKSYGRSRKQNNYEHKPNKVVNKDHNVESRDVRESSSDSQSTQSTMKTNYKNYDTKSKNPQFNKYDNKYDNSYKRNNYRGSNSATNYYGKKNEPYEEDRYSNKSSRSNQRGSDNWRQKSDEVKTDNGRYGHKEEKYETYESKPAQQFKKKLDAASQRERLEQMITHRLLECLVCCERLRHSDKIWSCKQCFHIMHLNCVIRWAKSSKLESGWRCPACQNVCMQVPTAYRCYCDKIHEPRVEPGNLPHSCGDVCGRKGRTCEHTCTLLCHPGPCPECTVIVPRACGCGATSPTVKCSSDIQITCQAVCSKALNCGTHTCSKTCHVGECGDCNEFIKQECFCGSQGRKVKCSEDVQGVFKYACGDFCEHTLSCGNHACVERCHVGDCALCKYDPKQVTTCYCGQTMLKEERVSCLDPIPCCDKVCNKKLKCGQPSDPHLCKENCHEGPCPVCPLTTMVRCRCGHMDRELACKELKSKADDARCQKKCSKKRLCCKHKCNQYCCIEVEHICPLPCNHLLSCGLHRCENTCHRGRCLPCWRTSFQELYCECGSSVLYPPVACGTRPPPCTKPCSRARTCGHEIYHNCHTGPCPPCSSFTKRWCHGHHEQRSTIPCHQEDFSCGMPCGKDMSCGRHKCIQTCHKGECPSTCTQLCTTPRANCEHGCNQRCHSPPCRETPCKQNVRVTCECGLRSSTRTCVDMAGEYQKMAMAQLASKMADIQRGQSVDITDVVNKQTKIIFKTLECTDECRLIDRNRRLAIGLQIRNPDLSSKLTPKYSEYMRNWAKKDPRFCQNIHEKLNELVQLAKQSKQKSRSHSFECMNREKRHFVHEYCEHFGVESAAYDKEPNRNIVATASRDKSWLPSISLLELFQRENGQRRVPGPVVNKPITNKIIETPSESVSLKLPGRGFPRPATPPAEFVDYFDNPP